MLYESHKPGAFELASQARGSAKGTHVAAREGNGCGGCTRLHRGREAQQGHTVHVTVTSLMPLTLREKSVHGQF